MSTLPDAAVRRRVAEELRTTFVVEAGAGTGKTTVLIQRLLGIVRSGLSRLDRVVAITFTEKAAGELKIRLRAEIEAALHTSLPENERRALREASGDLERAAISTIHSFCAGLLRERPVEAGVDPGFSVLGELGARLLRMQTWKEWLAQELNTSPAILKRALRLGLSLEHLGAVARFVVDHRDCLDMLSLPLPSPLPLFHQTLREGVEKLASLQRFCVNPNDRASIQIRTLEETFHLFAQENQAERLLAQGLAITAKAGNQSHWQPRTALADARALFAQLAEARDEARRTVFHNLSVELVRWLSGYIAYYQHRKREQSVLDFTDLLLFTRDLVRSNKEVRRTLQRRYDFILVDEFQDTDPLQVEVVFFLAEIGAQAEHWTEVELRPGKLFAVGDPCQSIYRFRRADMEIYTRACDVISRQGEVAALCTNFRARAPAVDWLNETFSRVMADVTQPVYRPLAPSRFEFHGKEVTLLPIPPERLPLKRSRGDERRAEAGLAAAFLKKVVEWRELSFWGERGVQYRDIAVLFRTHRTMEIYEEAFRNFAIPYRVFGGRRYYHCQEIGNLLALLRAIENPWDREALVAVLRSPFFGFSDEDLFLFTATGGVLNYTVSVSAGVHATSRFVSAFAFLSDFHHRRNSVSPAVLLEELYARTHIFALFSFIPQGEQRVANLLKANEVARALSAEGRSTLHAFVNFLDEMARMEWGEREPPTGEEEEDVVQLLTVHKAKGLEFPVVLLADVATPLRVPSRPGIIDRSTGKMELRLGPRGLACGTLGWQEAEAQEQAKGEEEEKRLLYVAATRARDHLVIPFLPGVESSEFLSVVRAGIEDGKEPPYGEAITPFGPEGPLVFVYDSRKLTTDAPAGFSLPERSSVPESVETKSLQDYQTWQTELEDIKKEGAQGEQVWAVTEMEEKSMPPVFEPGQEREPCPEHSRREALRLDGLVHEILRYGEDDPVVVEKLVRVRMAAGEDVVQVCALVRAALSSPVLARARAAEIRFHEVPFVYHHGEKLLEGIVDLAFVEDGALVVVDFKTDTVIRGKGLEEQAAVYKPQGMLYALALEQITGYRVKEVVLLFIRTQEEVIFPWGEEEQRLAEDLISGTQASV